MRITLILAGLLLAAGLASAQFRQQRWGNGSCAPVGVPAQVQYDWRALPGDPDRLYLYANGVQVGGWDYNRRTFRSFDARSRSWGPEEDCAPVGVPERAKTDGDGRGAIPKEMPKKPCGCGCKVCSGKCACDDGKCEAPACECQKKEPVFEQVPIEPKEMLPGETIKDGKSNFGLDKEKMTAECPDCACNDCKCDGGKENCQCHFSFRDHRGCPLSRERAFQYLANGVPDDNEFLRLTWVGPADQAAKIRSDLAAGDWGAKVCFQTYASIDDAMLKDTADGKSLGLAAGLNVQAPSGLPLWFTANYDGAQALTHGLLLAEARRRDPHWDPSKWPALGIEPTPPVPPVAPAPAAQDLGQKCVGFCQNNWGWMVGAGAAAYLLRRKRAS